MEWHYDHLVNLDPVQNQQPEGGLIRTKHTHTQTDGWAAEELAHAPTHILTHIATWEWSSTEEILFYLSETHSTLSNGSEWEDQRQNA